MKDLRNRVAVITGAASGIGRGLAERFAREGARLVLADIDAEGLAETGRRVAAEAPEVLVHETDVANSESVAGLVAATLERFGAAHVVCANAGIMLSAGPVWEQPLTDFRRVLDVNFWGVVHTVRAFVPRLLAQADESHLVITASMSGLCCVPGNGPYQASKHAVVGFAETLFHDLQATGANVGVTCLCPAFVKTPLSMGAPVAGAGATGWDATSGALEATALEPSDVAECVVEALREERFWLLTHPAARSRVETRVEAILSGSQPEVNYGLPEPRPADD